MSQITPTTALVDATRTARTNQGTAVARGATAVVTLGPIAGPSAHQALPTPLLEDLLRLLVRLLQGLLVAHSPRHRVGEPGGEHERVEDLALRRFGGFRVAHVRIPTA